jgi:Zn-dependent M16 (insulinase) family peptidase
MNPPGFNEEIDFTDWLVQTGQYERLPLQIDHLINKAEKEPLFLAAALQAADHLATQENFRFEAVKAYTNIAKAALPVSEQRGLAVQGILTQASLLSAPLVKLKAFSDVLRLAASPSPAQDVATRHILEIAENHPIPSQKCEILLNAALYLSPNSPQDQAVADAFFQVVGGMAEPDQRQTALKMAARIFSDRPFWGKAHRALLATQGPSSPTPPPAPLKPPSCG